MRRTLKKLLLLLAGSGMSQKEIRHTINTLQNYPPSLLEDAIQYLRQHALDPLDEATDSILSYTHKSRGLKASHHLGDDVPMRIEFLLRDEAGLKVTQAATELLTSLERDRPNLVEVLKPPNKESFRGWLNKLLQLVESSELLHHAMLVRNIHVQDIKQDWPLRGE